MFGPQLGQGMPADLGWMTRQLEDLRREIVELRAARTLESATVGVGGITITDNGSLTVKDTDGTVIAVIGALPSKYNRSDGSAQPGIILYREDGSTAAVLGDLNATVSPYKQSWQIFDRAGNTIFADDTNSGFGIAYPIVPGPFLADTNTATWPATTATTWTTIAAGYLRVEQPRLSWAFNMCADANTTGQFRLLLNGAQIGSTQTVSGGTSGQVTSWSEQANVSGTSTYANAYYLELQAQRTAGTGSARAIQTLLEGFPS